MARSQCITVVLVTLTVVATAVSFAGENEKSQEQALAMQKVHQKLSVDYFNKCWDLIDKQERSPDDVENMLLLSYASLWHWKQREDCKPLNLSIGYWQVSRVHALAGHYEMARFFADKCLQISLDNGLAPFYVGYAYEAMARAEALGEDFDAASEHLASARKQLDKIEDREEAELLKADLMQLEAATTDADAQLER